MMATEVGRKNGCGGSIEISNRPPICIHGYFVSVMVRTNLAAILFFSNFRFTVCAVSQAAEEGSSPLLPHLALPQIQAQACHRLILGTRCTDRQLRLVQRSCTILAWEKRMMEKAVKCYIWTQYYICTKYTSMSRSKELVRSLLSYHRTPRGASSNL